MNLVTAPLLSLVMQAAEDVIVLVDGLSEADFRRSRLTRAEARRRLASIASALAGLPAEVVRAAPEIDWDAWRATARALDEGGGEAAPAIDAAWFAATALAPATLSWLRVYRQQQPGWFSFSVGPDGPPAASRQ